MTRRVVEAPEDAASLRLAQTDWLAHQLTIQFCQTLRQGLRSLEQARSRRFSMAKIAGLTG